MKYLGLDLSLTATGVFVLSGTKEIYSAEIKTKPKEYPHAIQRCSYIADEILKVINTHKPNFIAIEDYFVGRQPKSVIKLAELGSIVRYKLLKTNHSFVTVMPTKLKKFVTGVGNCGKDLIIKDIFKKFNIDTNSNNIADATGLAFMAQAIHNLQQNKKQKIHKYQTEVIKDYKNKETINKPF